MVKSVKHKAKAALKHTSVLGALPAADNSNVINTLMRYANTDLVEITKLLIVAKVISVITKALF